jgi:hypothetical protein
MSIIAKLVNRQWIKKQYQPAMLASTAMGRSISTFRLADTSSQIIEKTIRMRLKNKTALITAATVVLALRPHDYSSRKGHESR